MMAANSLFGGTENVLPKRGGNRMPVVVLTRRGYLKLTKPMNDDRAWEVQGEMVERYFAVEQAEVIIAHFGIPDAVGQKTLPTATHALP